MKYLYLQTKYLPYGVDGNWTLEVNADRTISELTEPFRFRNVYIKIRATTGDLTPFFVNFSQIASLPNISTLKLGDVFKQDFDESYFTPVNDVPTDLIGYIHYHDARRLEFQIGLDCAGVFTPQNPHRDPSPIVPSDTPLKELPDLVMTKPRYGTNLARLHRYGLVVVNGFVHQTVLSEESEYLIYVKDAGKTTNISGYNRIGILDFEDIGEIQKFPLKDLEIEAADTDLYGDVIISGLPGSLVNKQVLLCLGGYLITPSVSFEIEDTNSVRIDLRRQDIETKIIEASKYIDLSSLGLSTAIPDPTQADISVLQSNAVLRAFLELSQSFLIVINKPQITSYSTYVRRYNNDRLIRANYRPTQILKTSTGKLLNYWNEGAQKDGKAYTLVHLTDFQQDIDVSSSEDYALLTRAFPDMIPKRYDMLNAFISIGFHM